MPTEVEILRAQVALMRECHDTAEQALKSAMSIAERDGLGTNWGGHRVQLRHALDTYYAARQCFAAADSR
jgi:hypothetical protein